MIESNLNTPLENHRKYEKLPKILFIYFRIAGAVHDDVKENDTVGFKTAKTTASVASGWAGGFLGGFLGNSGGAAAGNEILSIIPNQIFKIKKLFFIYNTNIKTQMYVHFH